MKSDELISKEDVIELIEEVCPIYSSDYRFILKDRVKNLPSINLPIKEKCQICPHCKHCDVDDDGVILSSAQPERKKGKWIHGTYYGEIMPEHKCSECETWEYSDEESNFCSYCGADMRSEAE